MSSSAPKFASFRPKPKVPEQPLSVESRREEKEHRKHSSSREKPREDRRRTPPREQREHDRDASSKRAYFSDRRGDLDIVKYGTLNRYDIPSYRRSGFGNVLGLPGQKIDREYSTEKKIYILPLVRRRQKRMLTDKSAARDSNRTLRLIKIAEDHYADASRDFIALSGTGKRKRTPGSDSEDDAPRADYRGIDEKPDPNKVDDADTYYESDTEAAIASSEITQKNSRLIRETRDDPGNLQAWLDLVEHQESMMKLDRAISELSAADRQNLADVRISTYEEALRKIGDNITNQIELQSGLLHEAQRHWDDAKVAGNWQDVLKRYPHSVKLWSRYIDFVQSTFSRFKYEECRAVFSNALEALRSVNSGDQTATAEARLHLIVRLTTMIQQAGYQELALAIWQAVLEFSLLAPQNLAAEKSKQFEEFWESEAPRIGETDCKGWRHTSIDDAVPPVCSITLDTSASRSSLEDFRKRELDSINKLRYPGRSTDEVGEDDPFHTVFFSDLKDYVGDFPELSADTQIDAFLCFCGLPAMIQQSEIGPWRTDSFLQSRTSSFETAAEMGSESLQYEEALSRYCQNPIARFRMTRDLLVQQTFSLDSSRLSPEFVRTTLKLLVTNIPDSECVGEYLLAFESRHFPSDVTKSAKRLLKERPSSVRLYNMYGTAEGQRSNSTKAVQIFSAALNIKSASVDRLELLESYVWQALQDDDKVEALRRLVQYHGGSFSEQSASASIETARAAFQASLEEGLLSQNYAHAVLNANHLALLAYLSGKSTISAALVAHSNLTAWFASHKLTSSVPAETHAQAIARLLAYHVTHTSIVKPALLRDALEPLIATFPDNTILLSVYAANEARFSIDDRLRGNMLRVLNTSSSSSVTTWAFAIHHESLKGEVAGSTHHSRRALYKRATHPDAAGAHCPALWEMYLRFELERFRAEQRLRPDKRPRRDGKKNKFEIGVEEARERVRETFYRGLKALPWCKDFVMLAFGEAGEVFGDEELGRLYGVMVEKEMRVYVEMDGLGA
ncbi:NRDE-2, necessary for RNA interference-domain-containing protein [Boeremia exigua]|uniref:NRDE-2, necessary for RNA interference-domain-containing protein n=1 Tax=Boeremia exigua TaxID=749465 RepID=UPI001E8E1241|nr:NRDE-2, necessary for RNA interference-domain-containing protein [Boeremia exigua]KAH6644815.1 NRDE-2, necessary for RNA interference-domain-containing protein [Boeremia exigua]